MASWLYGVARRVALRARREAARRRELERRRQARVGVAERVSQPPAEPWPELYEELDRLPEPFRAAVVLCDLEGHSYEQAAGILRCPVGTLQSRLGRGRQRLRRRLERRGLAPAIILRGSGAGPAAPSGLSPQLVTSIARAAINTIARPGITGATRRAGGCRDPETDHDPSPDRLDGIDADRTDRGHHARAGTRRAKRRPRRTPAGSRGDAEGRRRAHSRPRGG